MDGAAMLEPLVLAGKDEEDQSLFELGLRRFLGPAYISPVHLAFVNEIGDTAMQITEQAWLLEGLHKRQGVVVKSYRPHAFHNRGKPPRFRDLACQMQLLQTLHHRHLVSVIGMGCYQHDSWEDVCNSLFLVEEYAGPMTVARLIKGMAMHSFEMYLTYSYWDAMKWLEQLADALAYLHSLGVFHGDVRCQNLFFTSPDVHQTDVRLGDLKPHRSSYLQRSNLLTRELTLQEKQREDVRAPASMQHSLQTFKQQEQATNQAGGTSNNTLENPGCPNGLILPAISEDPAASMVALRAVQGKEGLHRTGSDSLSSSFVAAQTGACCTRIPSSTVAQAGSAAGSNVAQAGSATSSFVQFASTDAAQAGSSFVVARSSVQPASSKQSPVPTASSTVAQAGSAASSFVQPASSKHSFLQTARTDVAQPGSTATSSVVQPPSSKHSFVHTASSNVAQAGSAASSFVQPANSKCTPSKSTGQVPHSRLSYQSGDDDWAHSLPVPAPPHSLHNHNQAASLGESKDTQSVRDTQEMDALSRQLLAQVAQECPRAPNRGARPRRLARSSWSLGVGPTVRLNLSSHAADLNARYQQQGLKKVVSASHLPTLDSSPPQSSTHHSVTPTKPSLSPLLAQGPSTLPPQPLASSTGRHHSADAPIVGDGQLCTSVPPPRSSGGGSFPPLQQMGSGFLMATGGTTLARAAKQYQHQQQQQQKQQQLSSRQSSSSGAADGPGAAIRPAFRTSTSGGRSPVVTDKGGRSPVSVTTLNPPYGGGSGGYGAPLPFDDGKSWASPFSWNSHAANMGSLTRLPNEPAPHAAHHHKKDGSDRLPAGANPFVRFSYTHAHDYADMRKGIDPDVSVRSKFTSEMKDQVDTAYDRSKRGIKAGAQQQQDQQTQGDGHDQQMGEGQSSMGRSQGGPQSSMGRSLKKTVSFAAELPTGKLPASDVAIVYLAPEILTMAMARREGQASSSFPVSPSPESDTFAFAKVMYQLLWRSLLEPRAGSAEEELTAIQEYGLRVASGYREPMPYYWPEPVKALIEECWAQNPSSRPPMAVVKERIAAMRTDEAIKRELAVADKHHRMSVRAGTPPGSVNLTNPSEASCSCTIS